jgi:hypothetical protein
MNIPLLPDSGGKNELRNRTGSPTADFPEYYLRDKPAGQ